MVNLLDTLNTYWENFVGASAATLLTVLVVCSALLLGYLLIRSIAQLFMRGRRRWFLSDFVFLAIMLCYIIQSFFPNIFEPIRYVEVLPESEVVSVEE